METFSYKATGWVVAANLSVALVSPFVLDGNVAVHFGTPGGGDWYLSPWFRSVNTFVIIWWLAIMRVALNQKYDRETGILDDPPKNGAADEKTGASGRTGWKRDLRRVLMLMLIAKKRELSNRYLLMWVAVIFLMQSAFVGDNLMSPPPLGHDLLLSLVGMCVLLGYTTYFLVQWAFVVKKENALKASFCLSGPPIA